MRANAGEKFLESLIVSRNLFCKKLCSFFASLTGRTSCLELRCPGIPPKLGGTSQGGVIGTLFAIAPKHLAKQLLKWERNFQNLIRFSVPFVPIRCSSIDPHEALHHESAELRSLSTGLSRSSRYFDISATLPIARSLSGFGKQLAYHG